MSGSARAARPSLIGRLFGARPQKAAADVERLTLHLGEFGWRAQIAGQDARLSGTAPPRKGRDTDPLDPVFRAATQAILERGLGGAETLTILLNDPEILFSDARPDALANASPAAVRDYGAQLLNASRVACGLRAWPSGPDERRNGVYAFANAARLSGFLGLMDELAIRVTAITPVADVLIARAAQRSRDCAAVLYMDEFHVWLVMTNQGEGTVLVRTLPIGVMTLVNAIADISGVPPEETLRSLGQHDFMSPIQLERTVAGGALAEDPHQRAVAPLLQRLRSEVRTSLAWFDEQRLSGRPQGIEILGDLDRVKGLKDLLARALPLPAWQLRQDEGDPFALFLQQDPDQALNLLSMAEGSLITVGRISYVFENRRFVPSENLTTRALQRGEAAPMPAAPGLRDQRRQRLAAARSRAVGPRARPGWLDLLTQPDPAAAGRPGGLDRRRVIGYSGFFGLFFAALLGWGWMQVSELRAGYLLAADSYQRALDKNLAERARAGSSGIRLGTGSAAAESDKVLWTEKFLAIAHHMDQCMWLTDVYLKDQERSIGDANVLSQRLALDGAVLPSTHGHILEISTYIDRLLDDQDYSFMADFRDISFRGMHVDAASGGDVVRFGIDAWHDENKRLNREADGAGGATSLDRARTAVRQRNQELEAVTSGVER